MSEPIKAGDLVRVSSSHCAGFADEALGVIFVVERVLGLPMPRCNHCMKRLPSVVAAEGGDDWCVPLQYLTRIGDFPELADERHDEEIHAHE